MTDKKNLIERFLAVSAAYFQLKRPPVPSAARIVAPVFDGCGRDVQPCCCG